MVRVILILLLLSSVVLETSIVSFPFVLITSIMYFLSDDSWFGLITIFFASIILDSLSVSMLGSHGVFIFITLLIMSIYKKNYNLSTIWPLVFFGYAASFIYLFIFSYPFHLILFALSFFVFMIYSVHLISRTSKQERKLLS